MAQKTRREVIGMMGASATLMSAQVKSKVTKYVRYRRGSSTAYGILEGDTIREIQGGLFGSQKETGTKHKLADVKLLFPCEPPKILAVGLNYKIHLRDRKAPEHP